MTVNIGVLGGMGLAATGQFLVELAQATPAQRDQDHFAVVMVEDPSIPDRTTAILQGSNAPLEPIRAGLERLVDLGADLLVVPCNTAFHFIDQFADELPVPVIHIVGATLDVAERISPKGAWLTATTGTVRTQLYQKAAADRRYQLLKPDEAEQERIMAIVDLVKAGRLAESGARYMEVAQRLHARVPLPMVAGCTELPLAVQASGLPPQAAVSSLAALARATVTRASALRQART